MRSKMKCFRIIHEQPCVAVRPGNAHFISIRQVSFDAAAAAAAGGAAVYRQLDD